MQSKVDKNLVEKRFNKSILTYNENAIVQKFMAEKLVHELLYRTGKDIPDVLEIGCGSGLLTEILLSEFNINKLLLNDIVHNFKCIIPKLVNPNKTEIEYLSGDVEALDITGKYDIIISNATFQWLNDIEDFLVRISKYLKKDGIIAFTSFGPENIKEVTQIEGTGLEYIDYEDLHSNVSSKFEILYSDETIEKLYFNSPSEVLQHFKKTGVNALNKKSWTKLDRQLFEDKYKELFSVNDKFELTFNPLYFIIKLK